MGEKPQEIDDEEVVQTEELEPVEKDETVEAAAEEETIEEEEMAKEEIDEEKVEEEVPTRRKEEIEEEFVEERIYTIGLGRAWMKPPNKRAPKAVRIIRAFVQKHMKVGEVPLGEEEEEEEGGRIIISNEVNEKIWRKGIEKPPRKLRIRAAKDEEGNVTVFLA